MTLTDAQVDRWSRQILVPEIGGRGQERLLAARVALSRSARAGVPADAVVDLLDRAGVRVATGRHPDPCDLVIDLDDDDELARAALAVRVPLVRGRRHGATGDVLALVGRPCGLCGPAPSRTGRGGALLDGPAAAATAALVAAEVMRLLLEPPPHGRRQRLDLDAGTFAGETLATDGCAACRRAHA